jgi:hypothetical protein
MNEIKKYIVTGFSFDPTDNSLKTTYVELLNATQPVCMWSDVEPMVQRNKELEAESTRRCEREPAQEVPAELVEWANSWQEDDSDMPSYLVGCNDMKHFVKSQLDKMKGKS